MLGLTIVVVAISAKDERSLLAFSYQMQRVAVLRTPKQPSNMELQQQLVAFLLQHAQWPLCILKAIEQPKSLLPRNSQNPLGWLMRNEILTSSNCLTCRLKT
jgi:hypothetical protein